MVEPVVASSEARLKGDDQRSPPATSKPGSAVAHTTWQGRRVTRGGVHGTLPKEADEQGGGEHPDTAMPMPPLPQLRGSSPLSVPTDAHRVTEESLRGENPAEVESGPTSAEHCAASAASPTQPGSGLSARRPGTFTAAVVTRPHSCGALATRHTAGAISPGSATTRCIGNQAAPLWLMAVLQLAASPPRSTVGGGGVVGGDSATISRGMVVVVPAAAACGFVTHSPPRPPPSSKGYIARRKLRQLCAGGDDPSEEHALASDGSDSTVDVGGGGGKVWAETPAGPSESSSCS